MKERVESRKKISSSSALKLPKIEKQRVKEMRGSENKRRNNNEDRGKESHQKKDKNLTRSQSVMKQKLNPQVTAQAYTICNEDLTPVVEYQGDERRQIASITKFMTLYAAYKLTEKFNIPIKTTYFRVSTNAGNAFGTSAELDPKQWVTIEDLFYGLMLPSGNDAALVLSQNLGAILYYEKKGQSSTIGEKIKSLDITTDGANLKHYNELFVKNMNQIAIDLQMKDTFYTNVHGLDSKQAYSTAKDICILMKKVQQIPTLLKVSGTRQYFARVKFSMGKKQTSFREADWMNTNRMLWKRGYLGGKTGQTMGAGNCLANIYEKDGKKYYVVVLGCNGRQDRFRDTEMLVQKYIGV